MPTEIELKLSVPSRVAGCLYRHPLLAGVTAKRHQLQNIYFDTPELSFRNRGMALRLRRKGGRWLRTVKTMASGSGGLAVRGEWEIPATPGEWHFDDIPALPIRAALEEGAPPPATGIYHPLPADGMGAGIPGFTSGSGAGSWLDR